MGKIKKAFILCAYLSIIYTDALANTGDEMNTNETINSTTNSAAVILSANDMKGAISEKKELKTSLIEVVRETTSIGTAEHPTIEGGLMSAPELQALSEEKELILDERTALIFTQLNEVFNRSPAYNAKILLNYAKALSFRAVQNLKIQSKKIFRLWMKAAMIEANASIRPKQKNVHKAQVKSLKASRGVKQDA